MFHCFRRAKKQFISAWRAIENVDFMHDCCPQHSARGQQEDDGKRLEKKVCERKLRMWKMVKLTQNKV